MTAPPPPIETTVCCFAAQRGVAFLVFRQTVTAEHMAMLHQFVGEAVLAFPAGLALFAWVQRGMGTPTAEARAAALKVLKDYHGTLLAVVAVRQTDSLGSTIIQGIAKTILLASGLPHVRMVNTLAEGATWLAPLLTAAGASSLSPAEMVEALEANALPSAGG